MSHHSSTSIAHECQIQVFPLWALFWPEVQTEHPASRQDNPDDYTLAIQAAAGTADDCAGFTYSILMHFSGHAWRLLCHCMPLVSPKMLFCNLQLRFSWIMSCLSADRHSSILLLSKLLSALKLSLLFNIHVNLHTWEEHQVCLRLTSSSWCQ